MSEPKTNVPKFGSFRPKPTAPFQEEANAAKAAERKSHSHRVDDTRDKGHRQQHRDRRRSSSRERGPQRRTEIVPPHAQPKDVVEEPAGGIFVVDRKGDEKNLVYGSNHKYSVPLFHRFGAGHVLGAPANLKIDRDYADDREIVLRDWRDFKSASRQKYVFSKIERERPRLLKIRSEAAREEQEIAEPNFIPLQRPREMKRKRTGVGGGDSSGSDHDERDYRSIYGKAKTKDQPPDEDFQYATESDSSGSEVGRILEVDNSVRQKNMEFLRKVEDYPYDVDAWITLIGHQDTLIRAQDERRRATNAEIRSTADIKIHMYEKALDKARSLKDREKLLLGLMKEGEKIWEIRAQEERWEKISKDNIDSLVLWTNYLNFKLTSFSSFRHEEIKDVFTKRIQVLSKAVLMSKTKDTNTIYRQLIYILTRFSVFLRESGYVELAIAIWQAVLEINFYPPSSTISQVEVAKYFADFWEGEVPRIGEDGALGWRRFVENEVASDAPGPFVDEAGDAVNNDDVFRTWAKAERLRMNASRVPARTMDEVVEDDPYRVILFSDIEPFLVTLPPKSQDLRKLLIDGFLLFCNLSPVTPLEPETSAMWSRDVFIGGHLLDYDTNWIKEQYFPTSRKEIEASSELVSLSVPSPCISVSSETLFGSNVWSEGQSWKDKYRGDNKGPVSYKWIRNTLKQLTETHFTEDLADYYLAFEFRNDPATIKRTAKKLLKQHPTSVRLYNSYALIEWSQGNKDTARGIFAAALNLRRSLPEMDWDRESIVLWRSCIWAFIEDQDNNTALKHLLSVADEIQNADISVSPAMLLRTKQYLASSRDHLLSSGHSLPSIAYADCLMLLEYLSGSSNRETRSSSQGDISKALESCTLFSQTLISRNLSQHMSHEIFLQSAARLLLHHSRIGPFRPALIREHLTRFLSLFPQNTIFLSLYTWNEARLRIDNRVRNTLLSTVLTAENDTLTSRLYSIQYELRHGTIYSVRSAFEHALSSPASRSSAGLWRFYILYCIETPQFQAQAKHVWYRALRACPWAKELYLIGFQKMSAMLPFSELKSTWRIMGEKGLRVHVDLEDRFEHIADLEKKQNKPRSLGYK